MPSRSTAILQTTGTRTRAVHDDPPGGLRLQHLLTPVQDRQGQTHPIAQPEVAEGEARHGDGRDVRAGPENGLPVGFAQRDLALPGPDLGLQLASRADHLEPLVATLQLVDRDLLRILQTEVAIGLAPQHEDHAPGRIENPKTTTPVRGPGHETDRLADGLANPEPSFNKLVTRPGGPRSIAERHARPPPIETEKVRPVRSVELHARLETNRLSQVRGPLRPAPNKGDGCGEQQDESHKSAPV